MRVIALFGRGDIGKTHCLGHLINLIYQDTRGCNYFVEGQDTRVTLDYLGNRVTICTWGDNEDEESANLDKLRKDNPDIAIVATRTRGRTVKLVEKFCEEEVHCQPKWVEKYVASFDDISGQEYLNSLQAEQILDYIKGLIKGKLYYVDSISASGDEQGQFHITLLEAEMPSKGYPRTLSFELNADELFSQGIRRRIQEDDFVLYRPDSDHQFLFGNEEPLAITLRNESRNLRQELTEREIHGESIYALIHNKPDWVKSYHVNVGHGNCSLILSVYGNNYELWMVDCSTYDYLIRRDYSRDLYCCLSDIANAFKIKLKDLHISRFMLTHTHFDHYNGLSYLIENGHIDDRTIIYANLYYDCASPIWISILRKLLRLKCQFVEPLSSGARQMGAIQIYHPECRIHKDNTSVQQGERAVSKVNNSSVVYGIDLMRRIMVFPGDLEQEGFNAMSGAKTCSPMLFWSDYYVVSHHGSLNGHPKMPCKNPERPMPTPSCCLSKNLSKVILMGRDRAYTGIYSPIVTSYWNKVAGGLVCTEHAPHYVELDWAKGTVTYC